MKGETVHSTLCACGRTLAMSDISLCPFCKVDLSDFSEEASAKHIRKCVTRANPPMCGHGKVGRPSKKNLPAPDYLREDLPRSSRSCNNCGARDCPNLGSVCSEWRMSEPCRCRFCGREPQKVVRNGVLHSIVCGYCNLHMDAYDVSRGDEALVDRWNGGLLRKEEK